MKGSDLPATTVTVSAPGKVNLFFQVGPVRPDGYHPVASLYSAVSMREQVTVSSGEEQGISLSVSLAPGSLLAAMAEQADFDLAAIPLGQENLAYKAACAVLEAQGLKPEELALHLHIQKAVPVAGGMGGGSADAAATLLALDTYLVRAGLVESALGQEQLLQLAAPLGADVPFALAGGLAVGLGIGDQLQALELPERAEPLHLVMLASTEGLSTPAVFAELDRGRTAGDYQTSSELEVPAALLEALLSDSAPVARLYEVERYLRNDLSYPAQALQPELEKTLSLQAPGLVGAFVSGSGPTVAYLLESQDEAEQLAAALRRRGGYAVAVTAPDAGAQVLS